MEGIVERIRDLCRKKETSLTKIEKKLGYSNGTIGKWSSPKRNAPLEKVIAIAEFLGTTPEYLLTGDEQKKEPPAQGGELGEEVKEFIELYDRASPELRAAALAVLKSAESHQKAPGGAEGAE